jgi:hypothetical protein
MMALRFGMLRVAAPALLVAEAAGPVVRRAQQDLHGARHILADGQQVADPGEQPAADAVDLGEFGHRAERADRFAALDDRIGQRGPQSRDLLQFGGRCRVDVHRAHGDRLPGDPCRHRKPSNPAGPIRGGPDTSLMWPNLHVYDPQRAGSANFGEGRGQPWASGRTS